jgi:hypothetical protein
MATGDLTTLANVKLMLGVDTGDTTSDSVLNFLITSESAFFVQQIGRDILQASYTESLDGHSDRFRTRHAFSPWIAGFLGGVGSRGYGYGITLRNVPVASVQSVTVDGATIPAGSNPGQDTQVDGWILNGDRIELLGGSYAFTPGIKNVVITYTAGYSTVPSDVERGVIDLVVWRYRERDRVAQRSKNVGGENVTFMVDAIPPTTQAVIDSWRKPVKV